VFDQSRATACPGRREAALPRPHRAPHSFPSALQVGLEAPGLLSASALMAPRRRLDPADRRLVLPASLASVLDDLSAGARGRLVLSALEVLRGPAPDIAMWNYPEHLRHRGPVTFVLTRVGQAYLLNLEFGLANMESSDDRSRSRSRTLARAAPCGGPRGRGVRRVAGRDD
jgi:hypothetical protein